MISPHSSHVCGSAEFHGINATLWEASHHVKNEILYFCKALNLTKSDPFVLVNTTFRHFL